MDGFGNGLFAAFSVVLSYGAGFQSGRLQKAVGFSTRHRAQTATKTATPAKKRAAVLEGGEKANCGCNLFMVNFQKQNGLWKSRLKFGEDAWLRA
jgi:hypothetical protein